MSVVLNAHPILSAVSAHVNARLLGLRNIDKVGPNNDARFPLAVPIIVADAIS